MTEATSNVRPLDVHRTSSGRPAPVRTQTEIETEEHTSSGTEPQSPAAPKAAAMPTHARISTIDPWDALARVVSLLRPDWQPERIRGALLDDKRPPRDVVAAAVACALDPDMRHPAAIAHRATGRATPTPPAMRGDVCTTHLGELAATCRGCAADRKAAPTPESAPLAAERGAPVAVAHPHTPNA